MSDRMDWTTRLEHLQVKTASRVTEPASWDHTTARARRAAIGSVLLRSAGQATDEIRDAAIDNLPDDISDALHRVAPDFDLGALDSYPHAALEGLSNLIKGALFELRVADGIAGGSIPLPNEAAAFRLVDNFGMPGFDGQLLDAHGDVIDLVQLKASSHDAIIREALQKWPDVDVFMTTQEAAAAAARHGIPHVIDTGIADATLSAEVHGALVDQVSTSFGEIFDEIIPQITYLIIVGQAVRKLAKREQFGEVVVWARDRAKRATITSVVAGVAATVTGTDAIRLPVVIAMIAARDLASDIDRSANSARRISKVVDEMMTRR